MESSNQTQSQSADDSKSSKPIGFLKPDFLQGLAQPSLSQTLEKITNIEKLNSTNFSEWESSILMAFNVRDLECFLNPKWTASFPEDAPPEELSFFRKSCKQIYFWLGSQLDKENLDKFFERHSTAHDPAVLWANINHHYVAASAENCANVVMKIFGLKMDKGNVKETLVELRHLINQLWVIGPELFQGDVLIKVLAFFALKILPPSLHIVANNVYQLTKISGKLPFLDSVLSEIELAVARRQEQVVPDAQALKVIGRKAKMCFNGKHNPLAPHSESECFQLFPEKREAFYRRRLAKKDEPGPRAFSVQALAAVSGSQGDSAILDSGASYSLFKSSARFISFKQAKIPLFLADGSCIYASGIGTAVVFNHQDEPLHLRNSLVVPSINSCLIALSPFLKKECLLIGGREGSVGLQTKDGHTLLRGTISNNIIKVQLGNPNPNQVNVLVGADILHKCLGHPSTKYAEIMWPGVNFKHVKCDSCLASKLHHLPFKGTFPAATKPLQTIHMDLCGPIKPISRGKSSYVFQLIDGYSQYRFVYMLSDKSQCFEFFKIFKAQVENQCDEKIQEVVSENGGEFVRKEFQSFLQGEGIQSLLTSPHTPEQNPFSEWANRSLLEKARCLLVDSNLPHEWWGEAMATSAYLLNRTPVASIGFKTPYELYLGQLPKTSHLHVFGCLTFVNKAKANLRSKLDPRASKAIFLGAPSPEKKEFVSNKLPGGFQSPMVPSGAGTYPAQNLDPCDTFDLDAIFEDDTPRLLDNPGSDCNLDSEEDFMSFQNNPDPFVGTPSKSVSTEPGKVDTPNLPKGWVMDLVPNKAPKDITSAIDTENIVSGTRRGVNVVVSSEGPPRTYHQAMCHPKAALWEEAINEESASIEGNNVWRPVKHNGTMNLLGSTWVFKEKENEDGIVV
ncbi:hypothetical protein O181_023968 [Austropuccinia psidii MF-1]|uniref:Integrase catalytic domain-containing protein n=1 Tax=Austropuccinia psidii MF-1 TaxID=1389203 RepID=A0A9Q3GXS5_9BASI|nr:hypothetical protein [Austropuccinia psidii MF-1]